MAEQEQETEKKKPSTVKRVLKWIGLGLLALLLIAFIIFQAPWKVITLFVIILLACTVLPKTLRKWFWFSVGVVIIALIIWVFLPDDNEGWRPYTFDEELAALEAARSIPDSENAAIIYNQLLANYDANALEPILDPNYYDLIISTPWSSQDYPELAEWLQQQESTIAKLMQASKLEKCRFPIPRNTFSLGKSMERLSAMRRWARLLTRAANNDLGDGRVEQALEKYIAALQMGKHERQQPTMIDLLVGIAIEAFALRQFNRFIVTGDATEAHLRVIEKALAEIKHDWDSDLPRILEDEKLMSKNMICNLAYEINPNGQVRLSRDPTEAMRAEYPEELPPLRYWRRKLMKATTILAWFYMPSTPRKAGEIIDAKYEKIYAMAEPDFDWQKATEKPSPILQLNYRYLVEHLTGILEPAYHRIHDLYLRLTTDKRGSQIIIVLRRYKNKNGHWPESLDDIKSLAPEEIFVDPFNDGTFVYKPTDDDFTLYSKGKNNIDEDGRYRPLAGEEYVPDDWPIWPRPVRTRKTKEENADAEQQ